MTAIRPNQGGSASREPLTPGLRAGRAEARA